jgi:adenine deaminase
MPISQLIAAARGMKPVDLLLTNARIVNVFSGEILPGSIAVFGGRIVGFGDYPAKETIDLKEKIVTPGFIDPHLHIESAMVSVTEFCKAVLPLGTTTVVADPHEIANVSGAAGIRYMLDSAEDQPVNIYYTLPSCVPATDMETAGASLSADDLAPFIGHPRMIGLAEMMNFPGVLCQVPPVLAKIALARRHGLPVDGHAPGLSGRDLCAYIAAGVSSDHECTAAAEALEKLRAGMHIMIREGSGARNLNALLPLVTAGNCHRMMWCTDDRHPHDIMEKGHVDDIIRRAIGAGIEPVMAIRMATLNPAQYFGLSHLGAIAPGRRADLVILSDLQTLTIESVYANGILSAEAGRVLPHIPFPTPLPSPPAMNPATRALDFAIPVEGNQIRVMGVIPDQILTRALVIAVHAIAGNAEADPSRDLLKIAIVERHHGTGRLGKGFVTGMGLKRGAIASSVAHDSHNIIIVGATDRDMKTALTHIVKMDGGLAVALDGNIVSALPLPVAGLMSLDPLPVVRDNLDSLIQAAHELGSCLSDPFMALSFLALPVIPELKITDLGLVDVTAFKAVSLFV